MHAKNTRVFPKVSTNIRQYNMHRKLLTSKEAAQYLGISLSFLRKMMMNRIIPMYKPNGKLCYFDPEDLDAYLTSVRISSQDEIKERANEYLRKSGNHA